MALVAANFRMGNTAKSCWFAPTQSDRYQGSPLNSSRPQLALPSTLLFDHGLQQLYNGTRHWPLGLVAIEKSCLKSWPPGKCGV